MSALLKLESEDFEFFRREIAARSGISLSPAKVQLVETRLRSRVAELHLGNFHSYRELLESVPVDHPEWQNLLNEITTNKTEFFRESAHLDYLANQFIPKWCETTRRRELLVWSAACSTGEEPYSIAMVLQQRLPVGFSYHIHATDIDTKVLDVAKNGVYRRTRLKEVPEEYRAVGFDSGEGEIADWVRINRKLKSKISFEHFNLLQIPYPWVYKFDVIFCRNVLIYFAQDGVKNVTEGLYETTSYGGALFIGHTESLHSLKSSWKYLSPSIYEKEK